MGLRKSANSHSRDVYLRLVLHTFSCSDFGPMSYGAFTRALSDEIRAQRGSLSPDDFERAHRSLFNRWLEEGRHEALIRYMVENFDGEEGGEDYLNVLGTDLAKIGRPDLIRELYRPIIDRRSNYY